MANRLYVFLTYAVCGIGGTQIYVRNKLNYLYKKGWKTCVVSSEQGSKIIVKELKPYKEGIVPELANNPFFLSKCRRETIIDGIIKYIKSFADSPDEIIIESSYIGISPWGEILAQRLKSKHFIFFIQEDYRYRVDSYRKFFSFKLDRGELAINSAKGLDMLFEGFRNVENSQLYKLSPFCANSIEDTESVIGQKLPAADFYVGSFGRINKPFVMPMIDDLVSYAKSYPDKSFHLVLFGWTDNPSQIEEIDTKIRKVSNLSFSVTGPIYPVPRSDLKKMDVFVSTAGAAAATSREGIPTISIDDVDLKPIGIVGYTTLNTLHRGTEPQIELSVLLDKILFERKYLPEEREYENPEEIYSKKYDEHFEFLNKSTPDKVYYPIHKLKMKFTTRIYLRIRELLPF